MSVVPVSMTICIKYYYQVPMETHKTISRQDQVQYNRLLHGNGNSLIPTGSLNNDVPPEFISFCAPFVHSYCMCYKYTRVHRTFFFLFFFPFLLFQPLLKMSLNFKKKQRKTSGDNSTSQMFEEDEYAKVIEGIKKIYKQKIKPLEETYNFEGK